MHRSLVASVVLAVVLITALPALSASTIVVVFKDGTRVTAELPQDASQIRSVSFESAGGGGGAVISKDSEIKDVIFSDALDKGLGANWDSLECVGGNFGQFARFADGKLLVNVPSGNNWTKTGIMSKKPLFTVDNTMESSPMKIALDFDPSATTGYVITLAPVEMADVWTTQNCWFHWGISAQTKTGFCYVVNTQNSADKVDPPGEKDLSPNAPKRVVLSVAPGRVVARTSTGSTFVASIGWLKSGTPVYLHVFSHPEGAGGPASFALDAVTVGR